MTESGKKPSTEHEHLAVAAWKSSHYLPTRVISPAVLPVLSRRTLWLMAIACGACVANICYNQPLLGEFASTFKASPAQVGFVAMASQIGYGLGLLFFLPLGDIVERRTLVLRLIYLCASFLVLTALAPTLWLLIVGNLLIGATSMGAQILIPLAVELSPPEQRGQTVGVMMSGLLGGILLARTIAGVVDPCLIAFWLT